MRLSVSVGDHRSQRAASHTDGFIYRLELVLFRNSRHCPSHVTEERTEAQRVRGTSRMTPGERCGRGGGMAAEP